MSFDPENLNMMLESMEKLEKLRTLAGWSKDDPNYLKQKKGIMNMNKKKRNRSSSGNAKVVELIKEELHKEWVQVGTIFKAKDMDDAGKKGLLKINGDGDWKCDPHRPGSKRVRGEYYRGKMLVDTEGVRIAYARIVEIEKGKKYLIEQGTKVEVVSGDAGELPSENPEEDAEDGGGDESDSLTEKQASPKAASPQEEAKKKHSRVSGRRGSPADVPAEEGPLKKRARGRRS